MELKKLQERLITDTFSPEGDEGVSLTWDCHKFTGEVGRRLARVYRSTAERVEAKQPKPKKAAAQSLADVAEDLARSTEIGAALDDLEREMYADVLACDRYGILKEWGMTDEGEPVPPTYENLITLPGPALVGIFRFCKERSSPKSRAGEQTTSSNPTTSETTSDGSSSPITHSPASPIM